MILQLKNLTKKFGKLDILKGINLELKEGETLCILGKSGCGKSTMLRIIAELETKSGGESIIKDGVGVAMMFQNYALFPHLNVAKNIGFALHKLPRKERRIRINELLEKFHIAEIADRLPSEISGGQAQRVAFARALANNERLLLLDEPFSNIDHELKSKLRAELKELISQNNLSVIMVTHDKEDAFVLSNRIALMCNGEIMACDTPKNLYFQPKDTRVAEFLGDINLVDKKKTNLLDEKFVSWLNNKNFMFRSSDIKSGTQYSAKVIQKQFLGEFYLLLLEYNGLEFKVLVNSNENISDCFDFDLI